MLKNPLVGVGFLTILVILLVAWLLDLPEGGPRFIVAGACLFVFLVFGYLGWRANKRL